MNNEATSQSPDPPELAALQLAVTELRRAHLDEVRRRKAELLAQVNDDVDALRHHAEADRRRADELHRREESLRGGPCVFCGVEFSPWNPDWAHGTTSRWFGAPKGKCCVDCQRDRMRSGVIEPDVDHRGRVVVTLVGDQAIGNWVMPYLLDRVQFKWWYETPGAVPGGRGRFAYADVPALRARLQTREAPPPFQTLPGAEPCPRCGCTHMFRTNPGHAGGPVTQVSTEPFNGYDRHGRPAQGHLEIPYTVTVQSRAPFLQCAGCDSFDDIERVIQRLCGVSWGAARYAVHELRLDWFGKLPDDDPRRKLTLTPFAYLGDVAELRRRVAEATEAQRNGVPLTERRFRGGVEVR